MEKLGQNQDSFIFLTFSQLRNVILFKSIIVLMSINESLALLAKSWFLRNLHPLLANYQVKKKNKNRHRLPKALYFSDNVPYSAYKI